MRTVYDEPISLHLNELYHYGVSGQHWYNHRFGNWERHAKYANGQPNPETSGKQRNVFISGTSKIKVADSGYYRKKLPKEVVKKVDQYIKNKDHILIGDAPGIDTEVQKYLAKKKYKDVTVYTIEDSPRAYSDVSGNLGWKVKHIRADPKEAIDGYNPAQVEKDKAMSKDADTGFAVVLEDGAKATRNNVKRMQDDGKDVEVFSLQKDGNDIWEKKLKYTGTNDVDKFLNSIPSSVKNAALGLEKETGLRKKIFDATPEEDMKKVNPLFHTGIPDVTKNCIYCTAAYELRRRGYDVKANNNTTDKEGLYASSYKKWFPNAKLEMLANANTMLDNGKTDFKDIGYKIGLTNPVINPTVDKLGSQGKGARGVLLVQWKEGWGGHALSYEVGDKGKVVLRDSQRNRTYEKPRNILKDCYDTRCIRLDNLDFDSKKIKEAVK